MTSEEQLRRWVAGDPIHNDDRDECCPDFSCCRSELLAPSDVRQRFARAQREGDETTRTQMLGMFFGAAVSSYASKSVYIAGVDDPECNGIPQ